MTYIEQLIWRLSVVLLFLCCEFVGSASAATVTLKDYIVAGSVGDTWTYVDYDTNEFSWTLEEVTVGPDAGHMKLGNSTSGIIFSVSGNAVTWYEVIGEAVLSPALTFAETYQTDEVSSVYDTEAVFLLLPSLTVEAGTFSDVLVVAWLDSNYSANSMNTALGIDMSVTASAVTDIDYFAKGVGAIKHVGVAAETGISNDGYELKQYSPATPTSSTPSSGGTGGGLMGVYTLVLLLLFMLVRRPIVFQRQI